MTARPGDLLAHYRLAEKIGEGGMGVVYKALDTRLGRPVALKFLPEAFARDPERLARFEREARLLAALDDPRIAAIHGFEEADGVRFLVMELVASETLAERLARGPLPVREALAVCLPIACALEAAHERGIIHRDLKPANVKVTPDGKVKVLDFGLAKVFAEEPLDANSSQSPTLTYRGSRAGVILGTAAYMSPEQARGLPLDRRTDIWSFGCVLYEALTGRQAFAGQTASDCIARILEREPDWRALPAATPAKEILVMLAAGGPPRHLLSGLSHVWDPGGRRLYFLSPGSRGGTHLQAIDIDEARAEVRGEPEPISALTGFLRDLSISRDGRHLAVSELEGSLTLTRLPLTPAGDAPAEPEEVLSDGSFNDRTPAFSPDGRRIAFASNRLGTDEIWILDIGSRRLEPLRFPGRHLSTSVPSWFPDGRRIAVMRVLEDGANSLWITAIDGSHSEEIVKMGPAPRGVFVSPDGRSVAYGARREESDQIYVSDLATRKERRLTNLPGAEAMEAWSPDGRWIYIQQSHGNIYRLPAAGGPLQQVTHFPESGLFIEEPTLSPDGRSLAYCRWRGGASLWLLTLAEGRAETSR